MKVPKGRNEKLQNEQREECIKIGWEPLVYMINGSKQHAL